MSQYEETFRRLLIMILRCKQELTLKLFGVNDVERMRRFKSCWNLIVW